MARDLPADHIRHNFIVYLGIFYKSTPTCPSNRITGVYKMAPTPEVDLLFIARVLSHSDKLSTDWYSVAGVPRGTPGQSKSQLEGH